MLTTMSSKGQVVIPKEVRHALRLGPKSRLSVRVENGAIVLQPVEEPEPDPIDALCGMLAGYDLLSDLEEEHRREVERDEQGLLRL